MQRCEQSVLDPSGDEDWHTEKVNGSQFHVLKGLKEGLAYKVRVVAGGQDESSLHRSEELLVKLPGEASSQPQGLVGYVTAVMHAGRCVEAHESVCARGSA